MSEYDKASAVPSQPQLYIKETYFQTPKAVLSPNAAPKKVMSPKARTVFATSHSRRDSKHEPTTEYTMGYNRAIASATVAFEEDKTLKKRLSTSFCSAWRAFRKCICSPRLSELDDVNSNTAQLLYADRHQPIYGYGSITAGAKPTILSDNAWSSPQRGSTTHGARPTPKENFVV